MRFFSLLAGISLLSSVSVTAQLQDNVFRNTSNEHYWQNRKPDAAYWQQDVAYNIKATIHEDDNRIEGTEELTYWNNSPDVLTFVYFHLYQNAFVKGAYLHDLERLNHVKPNLGPKEAAGLGTTLDNIQVNGQAARTELDNTIIKVYLPTPLLPGAKAVIKMGFNTYFDNGQTRRRMKMYDAWGFKHYNGCQWYPKLSVYDRNHGWDTYQHLNKEFYGDYGVFDVTLDFPANYIVEASGELQNRAAVLPDTLRAKLDIKNFAAKKPDEAPSVIIPYVKGERKQWHYVANNVHDFAFTGDPSYRIGTAYWKGIECVAVVQESHAAGWQNATDYMTKIIKTFSEDIGLYRYPKIVAADAQDGMEYPMITMDGGSEPGYRGLLVHEIGHNWFYGQVGSNETYRAAMDEGFTQFLTAQGLRHIDGDTVMAARPKSKYRRHFAEPQLVLDRTVANAYASSALNQNEVPLNTHSDDFHNALNHGGGYGTVYYKTANMLYNLQYVLGDSLFTATMHHYFEQWKFAHPYFEDFRTSVIQFTSVDLSWFFDEWFETTKTIDYSIKSIHKIAGTDSFAINLRRGSDMQMPLDFTVTSKSGAKTDYHIPNTWFIKPTAATVLPKWYGFGKFEPDYTAKVQIPGGIRNVQLDPSFRLADRYLADNFKAKGFLAHPAAIKTRLDGGLAPITDRRHYRLYIRPDVWWNPIDGIKAGAHLEGDYLGIMNKIDATVWYNTHVLQADRYLSFEGDAPFAMYSPVNYSVNYTSPITRNMPKLVMQLNSRYLDGGWFHRGGLNWTVNEKNTIIGFAQTMWRKDAYALDYLLTPADWSSTCARPNTSLNLAWIHNYGYVNGNGRYTFSLRAPFLNGNSLPNNYSYAQFESVNYNTLGKLDIRTRLFGRYGMGTRLPQESLLYMAGASPEELMENKYTRSKGMVPDEWAGISRYDLNHFQQGGGLNLRGYAGYNAPDEREGVTYQGYKGRAGAAFNMEVGFENYLPFRPRITRNWLHVNLYAFADAGVMELSSFSKTNVYAITPTNKWSDLHIDAGLGTAFTIKNWGVFEKAKPLTLRFDMPLFINRAPYSNAQYVTFRYVVGVNRTF
ncbi:MAG: M1 family metallopeptidase [Taibaiella sp.]|nr:M1 family metallopeptidase [Taibaiella sp.]